MDYIIDFLNVGNGDAIVIWGRDGDSDYVIFLDGGNKGYGDKSVKHYEENIMPHLNKNPIIGFINSHPHADHINGLIEIVEKMGNKLDFGIYNDPVECISIELRENIKKAYFKKEDPDITHLYETFEQIEKLNELCDKYKITRYNAYSENNPKWNKIFNILSPSLDYYVALVQSFTDVDFLKNVNFSLASTTVINELDEGNKPCQIVDEQNETSPENLSSTILQLTDSFGRKYLLTSDSGIESFEFAESNGFDLSNIHLVQMPHHGSRRNVNTNWLKKFNADFYIASASGDTKHPRRAVVNCIKKNVVKALIYSTHLGQGTLSYTTNKDIFPDRKWSAATPL